jgi:3-oxoacyl-[acyl-carrier protein] reductase
MFDAGGTVAIVTGGNSTLGRAIAGAFHAAGASVLLAARNDVTGEAAERELGERALFVRTDIGDDASIAACVATALARFGRIDFLVNNAVVYTDQGLDSTREQWLEALNINLVGSAVFVREVAREMAAGGAIVNIGSVGGKFGASGRAVYPACKAALLQLTKNQAVDLAPRGIRVNSVSPGWTWSDPLSRMTNESRELADAACSSTQPLGRAGVPSEVGQAVLFLCSPAASFITGEDLAVDGGFSMLGPDQGRGARYWIERASSQASPRR